MSGPAQLYEPRSLPAGKDAVQVHFASLHSAPERSLLLVAKQCPAARKSCQTLHFYGVHPFYFEPGCLDLPNFMSPEVYLRVKTLFRCTPRLAASAAPKCMDAAGVRRATVLDEGCMGGVALPTCRRVCLESDCGQGGAPAAAPDVPAALAQAPGAGAGAAARSVPAYKMMKECSRCHVVQPAAQFQKSTIFTGAPYDLTDVCKACLAGDRNKHHLQEGALLRWTTGSQHRHAGPWRPLWCGSAWGMTVPPDVANSVFAAEGRTCISCT